MLRGIGGIMIFAGCLGLGLWHRSQLTGRVSSLRLLGHLLELLTSEIRYGRATLPECCRHAAAQMPKPFADAMRQVEERMRENTGATFAEVFRECLSGPLKDLPLKTEDRVAFFHFLSESGFMDRQMQMRIMEQSCELMADTVKILERENAEKCRMAVGLGAMGGLLLILVLW